MATHRALTLSPRECRDLLSSAQVGRVVFTDRALPSVLPVAFVLDDDAVVIRTSIGSRLARAAEDAVLAFEVDDVDLLARNAWSVVVTGQARLETDAAEVDRLGDLLASWAPGRKGAFIRIPLTIVSGRRLSGIPTPVAGPLSGSRPVTGAPTGA